MLHGQALTCSHPACQERGVRFRYCAVCQKPVARRNFSTRHDHPPDAFSSCNDDDDDDDGDDVEHRHPPDSLSNPTFTNNLGRKIPTSSSLQSRLSSRKVMTKGIVKMTNKRNRRNHRAELDESSSVSPGSSDDDDDRRRCQAYLKASRQANVQEEYVPSNAMMVCHVAKSSPSPSRNPFHKETRAWDATTTLPKISTDFTSLLDRNNVNSMKVIRGREDACDRPLPSVSIVTKRRFHDDTQEKCTTNEFNTNNNKKPIIHTNEQQQRPRRCSSDAGTQVTSSSASDLPLASETKRKILPQNNNHNSWKSKKQSRINVHPQETDPPELQQYGRQHRLEWLNLLASRPQVDTGDAYDVDNPQLSAWINQVLKVSEVRGGEDSSSSSSSSSSAESSALTT